MLTLILRLQGMNELNFCYIIIFLIYFRTRKFFMNKVHDLF